MILYSKFDKIFGGLSEIQGKVVSRVKDRQALLTLVHCSLKSEDCVSDAGVLKQRSFVS